jgi:hypothetical protein
VINLLEEPVEHDGVLYLFNTSLADIDLFDDTVISRAAYPDVKIGWNVPIGPITSHATYNGTEIVLKTGPLWERAMDEIAVHGAPSARRIYFYIRDHFLSAVEYADVLHYHQTHTNANGDWWTEEYYNRVIANQYDRPDCI